MKIKGSVNLKFPMTFLYLEQESLKNFENNSKLPGMLGM
jgi:hypothetical protein